MVQIAKPISDVTTDNWITTPLWPKVSDDSDSTFIAGPAAATTQCELALASLTDPVSSTGHILYARSKVGSGGGAVEKLTWYLYEGATLRATSAATTVSRTTITTYSYTLTATESDSLTAYTDLRIRLAQTTVGALEVINVYDVWLEVPDLLAFLPHISPYPQLLAH